MKFIWWQIPEAKCGSVKLESRASYWILHQESFGRHLSIDVPVEAGRGERVEGGAVGGERLPGVIEGKGASYSRSLIWQVWNGLEIKDRQRDPMWDVITSWAWS